MKILVETSARHIHVTDETLEKLFGKGYQLTVKKMLSQMDICKAERMARTVLELSTAVQVEEYIKSELPD